MAFREIIAAGIVLLATLGKPLSAEENWPQFRGPFANGISKSPGPIEWDVPAERNVRWKVSIPGLGHSSPIVWNDRIFLTTAVAVNGDDAQKLRTGLYGDINPVNEQTEYRWLVLCLDKATGKTLWEREAHRGVPKQKRHPKSTHANSTPATDGKRVVAFFGSEGLFCYDMDGNPLWQRDFGVLESSFFVAPDAQWGFASSPVLHEDSVVVLVDVLKNSFIARLDANTGDTIWQTPREDVPTWGTPTVYSKAGRTQVIVNGFKQIAGYNFENGRNRWTMNGGGDIPVPTPIVAHDLVFITGAHGPQSPTYAIRITAEGDISLAGRENSNAHVVWGIRQGGNYMQTMIVVGEHLYACRDNGVLTCYEATTGKRRYRERLDGNGFTASPVAAGDKLYFTSEDGKVHVVRAGPEFELVKSNDLGDPCLATPAVSDGTIFFRTQKHLVAVQ